MNTPIRCLTAACVLALAACADKTPEAAPAADDPAVEAAPADAAAPAPAPQAADTPAPAAAAPGSDAPAATVADCATEIEGNDLMQFNVGAIVVPASCTEFTITLKHVGTMPVTAMGHNVVIAKASDVQAVNTDGLAAGPDAGYVKAGDTRIVAHTDLIGGGQTTSVTFPVSKLQGDGPYEFFCSFPGHAALMKGSIAVGNAGGN